MCYEVTVDEVTPAEWELSAGAFADYSIYQTWAYQQVRAETDGQQVHRVVIRDENGLVCSLCQVRVKAVDAVRLRVGYVQWGPLVRRKNGERIWSVEMFKSLKEALFQKGVNVLRIVPNLPVDSDEPTVVDVLKRAGFSRVQGLPPYRTLRVAAHDSEEGVRARLRKSFRRDLKKAEETGIQVEHSHSEESYQILESLYRVLLDRKHFKGLDPQEFTKTHPLLSDPEKMTFVVARLGGEPVAVTLSSNLGDTGIMLLVASNDRGLECGASYVIWYQSVLAALKAGMTWCDLGGIDPEANPSVYQFKSRLGGDEVFHIGAFECCATVGHKVIWSVGKKVHRLFK